ncbi:MAG TPA: hypothetical protein DHV59_02695 [Oxalobacteraceae bacterium]|nr:hypothetical protein [Oxalobacteraceae bacterium]
MVLFIAIVTGELEKGMENGHEVWRKVLASAEQCSAKSLLCSFPRALRARLRKKKSPHKRGSFLNLAETEGFEPSIQV